MPGWQLQVRPRRGLGYTLRGKFFQLDL